MGLTIGEQRAHFALWSLYKSPLLISADLRVIDPQVRSLVQQHAPGSVSAADGPLHTCSVELSLQGAVGYRDSRQAL